MTEQGHWLSLAREFHFVDAAARARLGGAPPEVAAALDDLAEVERAVKSKRYGAAARALKRYRDLQGGPGDASLSEFVNAEALARALSALESSEHARIHEVGELRERLAPAFAHPVTEAEAHNAVGVLSALQEDPGAARAAFDRALELDPRHYRALTNVGNLLLESGDPAGAEGYYRRALAINGEYAGAHHNLAVALRRQRRVAASVRSLKTGQRLMVRQANQEGRAEARERLGRLGTGRLGEGAGKWLRWILIALVVAAALYFLRGGH